MMSSSGEMICTQQPYSPFTLSFPDHITYSTTFMAHTLQTGFWSLESKKDNCL